MECAPHCNVHSYKLLVTKTLCSNSMFQIYRHLKKYQMDIWLYVAGPNLVPAHGLRHGDDEDDNKEEWKRIGRRTRKSDEWRTKMRRTRNRRMMN